MYWDQFAAQWEEQKHRVRQRWDKLTDGELQEIQGKWERLVARIMARYGLTIRTAEGQIFAFLHSVDTGEVKPDDRPKAVHHPMNAERLNHPRHFHVRWSNGALDHHPCGSREEADHLAQQLVQRDETYSIEEFNDACQKCAETRAKFSQIVASK